MLMSAYQSSSGWVRYGNDVVMSPRRIRRLNQDDFEEPAMCIQGLMVARKDWIKVEAGMEVVKAREWIESQRGIGEMRLGDDAVLVVVGEGESVEGVLELGDVM